MAQDSSPPMEPPSPFDPPTTALGDSATAAARIRDLYLVWERAGQRGEPRSPEDICRDCAELTDALRDEIARNGTERLRSDQPRLPGGRPDPGSWTAPPWHPPGYVLEAVLGRGGMGGVYRARQIGFNRTVALKMISLGPDANERTLARFRVEAEAVARLQHPHIVQVYEIGEHEGTPFYTFEYCPGGSLNRWISGAPLPGRVVAPMMETLARTIHFAHEHGILHRDLKPSNILLQTATTGKTRTDTGETVEIAAPIPRPPSTLNFNGGFQPDRWVCKISDFGLAKRLDEPGDTASGAVLGTPSYMAPEQASGNTDAIGPAVDVYGLGTILYELITGKPPFAASTVADALILVRTSEPERPSRLNPNLPADLETICLKCLSKEPRQRYASAEELADDLARFAAGDAIKARPVSLAEQAWRWARRNPVVARLSGLATFLLVAMTVVSLWVAIDKTREVDRLQQTEAAITGRDVAIKDAKAAQERRQAADREAEAAIAKMKGALEAEEVAVKSREAAVKEMKEAEAARDMAVKAAATAEGTTLKTLVKLHVSAGVHAADWRVDAPTTGRDDDRSAVPRIGGDPEQALLWFSKAWELDPEKANEPMHRMRVAWALRQMPDLVGLCLHRRRVLDASFNSLGTRVLTRDADAAYVWNPILSRLSFAPLRHDAPMTCAAFSPDGAMVVTASVKDQVRLWDSKTGKILREWSASARHASFSPDGKLLAVAGDDGKIRFWNPTTGQRASLEIEGTRPLRWVGYSPKGTWIAALDNANQLRLYQAKNGAPFGQAIPHAGLTKDRHKLILPHFDPAEKRMLTSSGDEAVLWELAPLRVVWRSPHHKFPITDCDFAVGKTTLVVTCDGNSAARRWTIDGDNATPAAEDDSRQDWLVALSPDGKSAAVSSYGGQLRRLNVESWSNEFVCKSLTSDPMRVAFSRDGRLVLSAAQDGTVRIHSTRTSLVAPEPFDFAGGRPDLLPVLPEEENGRSIVYSKDGRWQADFDPVLGLTLRNRDSDDDPRIKFAGKPENKAAASEKNIPIEHELVLVKFTPDSKTLMVAEARRLRFWDVATGAPRGKTIKLLGRLDADVSFSDDGGRLLGAIAKNRDQSAAFVWDTRTGEELYGPIRVLREPKQRTALSADGKLLAHFGPEGTRIYDVDSKVQIRHFPQRYCLLAEFAKDGPEGARILMWADSGPISQLTVQLWNIRPRTPQEPAAPAGPALFIPALGDDSQLHSDGRRVLAFRPLDQCAFLYDGLSGDLLAPPLFLPKAQKAWLNEGGTALISARKDALGVKQWPLAEFEMDRAALRPLAELMTNRVIDPAGNVVPLSPDAFQRGIDRFRAAWLAWRHPGAPDDAELQPAALAASEAPGTGDR